MTTIFVWMLVMTSQGSNGQVTRTIIDNMPTLQECQRVRQVLTGKTLNEYAVKNQNTDIMTCVQYQKVITK